ncbi:hypothetical protein P5624_00115 (plasmid) [Bacillus subtilis]|nr:hypothetical protein P5624_00115 [Bacillus subtilis]
MSEKTINKIITTLLAFCMVAVIIVSLLPLYIQKYILIASLAYITPFYFVIQMKSFKKMSAIHKLIFLTIVIVQVISVSYVINFVMYQF